MKTLQIPEGIEYIKRDSLEIPKDITEIIFPNSLVAIDYNIFKECTKLQKVTFRGDFCPAMQSNSFLHGMETVIFDVKEIDSTELKISADTFIFTEKTKKIVAENFYCKEIMVDDKNDTFASIDGMLYNFDKNTLLGCPRHYEKEEIVLPDSCDKIAQNAFMGNRFDSIDLNKTSIVSLGAFKNCLIKEIISYEKIKLLGSCFIFSDISKIILLGKAKLSPGFIYESPFSCTEDTTIITSNQNYENNKKVLDDLKINDIALTEKVDVLDYLLNNSSKQHVFTAYNNILKENSER